MTTPLAGIDISHWQAKTPPLGTTLEFVFVKATEATTVDPMWATHAANVRSAGKVLGAYHFGRHGVSPKAQAAAFLNTIGPVKLVALDLERAGDNTTMSHDEASAFIAAVQASGRKVGLYHSESGFPHVGQDYNWIAKWGTEPPAGTWAFWQWSGQGVDKDRFAGTIEQLHELAGYPAHWEVDIPAGTPFMTFTVDPNNHLITGGQKETTVGGVHVPCSPPVTCHYRSGIERRLVKLGGDGPRAGEWVNRRWAHQ